MSKSKQESVKEAIDRMANIEVPKLMEQVMADTKIPVEERVTTIGLLETVHHHLKLLQARTE